MFSQLKSVLLICNDKPFTVTITIENPYSDNYDRKISNYILFDVF